MKSSFCNFNPIFTGSENDADDGGFNNLFFLSWDKNTYKGTYPKEFDKIKKCTKLCKNSEPSYYIVTKLFCLNYIYNFQEFFFLFSFCEAEKKPASQLWSIYQRITDSLLTLFDFDILLLSATDKRDILEELLICFDLIWKWLIHFKTLSYLFLIVGKPF